MNFSFEKTTIKCTIAVLSLTLIVGCSTNIPLKQVDNGKNQTSNTNTNQQSNDTSNSTSSSPVDANLIVYKNTEYGFNFSLPKSWKGYSIITGKWTGSDIKSGNIVETGLTYSIRHPKWTSVKPRQDIPIMVFTVPQWELIKQEKLSVSAAPIGPSELGRNNNYVFALPARYNFAYPLGYEEVEQILKSNPLR
ncbi:hypothetical protein [Clostridium sp.]|uniref:hypothetical protein n=1 Tax=Clostridium sp. TaxID=1506 RepID=UPI001A599521|nr:hypothetical protein [Clostridium sp.]MBK5237410.1 hypothetical protein [Clostridium sp.]